MGSDNKETKSPSERSKKKEKKQDNSSKKKKTSGFTTTERMMKFLIDKSNDQDYQKDNILLVLRDLIKVKLMALGAVILPILMGLVVSITFIVSIIVSAVSLVIFAAYHSPFAFLLPPLDDGETVREVAYAYVAEFYDEVDQIVEEHKDCDEGELIIAGSDGTGDMPSNLNDIMAVYMVRYGYGQMAVSMTDENKANLKVVVNDMCSYKTEIVNITEEQATEGEAAVLEITKLIVTVELKTYEDMISIYDFSEPDVDVLNALMKRMP